MRIIQLFLLLTYLMPVTGIIAQQTQNHHPEIPFMNDLVLVEEVICSSAKPDSSNGVTEVNTILGKSCRVLMPSSESGWFAYRLGSEGNLKPGKSYFLEVEYPDDVDRNFVIHNRGGEYNRGIQTGKTLGDSYSPPYVQSNPESLSLPLSRQYKKCQTLFWLHDHYAGIELPRNNGGRPEGPDDGFLVIISQFDSLNSPMNKGAAVSAIRLYEAPDFETLKMDIQYPPAHLPRRHLFFREEMADGVVNNDPPALKDPIDWYEHKAQLMHFLGMNTFSKDLLEFGHNQGWDPGPYASLVNTPSFKGRWEKIIEMLKKYELDVLPYYEYAGTIGPMGLGIEKRARPLGDSLPDNNYTHISWTEKANADITDPDTYSDLKKILERTVVEYKDEANFVGVWLRPRPSANPVSFSDAALQRFSNETNHVPVTREELRTSSMLYDQYLEWWFRKRKDFLMAMRDYLKNEDVNAEPVVLYTADATESGRTHPEWSQSHNIISDEKTAWEKLPGDYPVFSLKEKIDDHWHLKAQLLPVKSWDKWEWNHSVPSPDPDTYRNSKGALMTYTFNKAYTVGSETAFDAFRSESGLAIIRHYCLNEDAMKGLGYFVSDIEWHDCYTMLGEARAMAHGDPRFIGYLASSAFNRASLPYVREFNANFLALPALPSELLENASNDAEVTVRKIETKDDGTYLAIVNTGLHDKFGVTVTLPFKGDVTDAKTGKMILSGVSEIKLDMYPAQLKSLIVHKLTGKSSIEPQAKTRLPEGNGLAARYPGDAGIADDKAVVFSENFESYKGERFTRGEMGKWDNYYNDLFITRDKENVHSGNQALMVKHSEVPRAHGAVKEVAGYDTLFVRFYLKFHPEFPATHHAGMYIRGGQKGALFDNPTGTKPTGADHFSLTLDHLFPGHGASPDENDTPPGWVYNYCYHMDQNDIYGDILLPTGNQHGSYTLGEDFIPRANINPERNRWYCYELMVVCNTPGQHNGRAAIWLDGNLLTEQPNLSFRTVESLKARFVTLSSYSSRKADNNIMWYDDIVVATEYIGPMAKKP